MPKALQILIRVLFLGSVFQGTPIHAQAHYTNGLYYINLTLLPGLNLIGLELETTNHTIASLFRGMPEGMTVYQIVQGGFTTNVFKNGQWQFPEKTIALGEGVLLLNPTSQQQTFVYGGSIVNGVLTNYLPQGLSIRCGMIPMTGTLSSQLVLKLSRLDNVYLVSNGALKVFTYVSDKTWRPSEPDIMTGEAFMVNTAKPVEWVVRSGVE